MKRSTHWMILGVLMVAVSVLSLSTTSSAQIGVGIAVRIGPPALPVYAQPICPGPGYLWTPGYWAWNDDGGYYWVPGTWVIAPVGMLWTPGYWGWGGGFYMWHPGYWGPHVGFYGGINYGFGYGGVGFFGGEWRGGGFYYNRSVTNVNVTNVTNVYNRTVIVNNTRNVSFNGPGGIEARPTREDEQYGRERHMAPLAAQTQQERAASQNRQLFASENHGSPAVAATARPGEFSGRDIVRAKSAGAAYRAPNLSPREARVQPAGNRDAGNRGSSAPGRNSGNPQRNSEMRNNQPGNRGPEYSRENSNPNRQDRPAPRQDRQMQMQQQRQVQMQHQRQAQMQQQRQPQTQQRQAEQKRNDHDQHR